MTNKKPVSGQLTNNKKLLWNDTTSLPLVIISSDLNNLNRLPEVKFARKSFCPLQVVGKSLSLYLFWLRNYYAGTGMCLVSLPDARVSWGPGYNYHGPGSLLSCHVHINNSNCSYTQWSEPLTRSQVQLTRVRSVSFPIIPAQNPSSYPARAMPRW